MTTLLTRESIFNPTDDLFHSLFYIDCKFITDVTDRNDKKLHYVYNMKRKCLTVLKS
jgi:hypothetical protein